MDELEIVKRTIEEHMAIKGHVKLVGDSISDQEALLNLATSRTDWIPGRIDGLREKQEKLQQTLSSLDEGLRNHFAFEEKLLPPLLGELLMRALVLDHEEIVSRIEEAKSLAAQVKLESLGRDELLSRQSLIKNSIESTGQLIEAHAEKEEVVLGMLHRVLSET